MTPYCYKEIEITNNYNFDENTPVLKVDSGHYIFIFAATSKIYVIPIKKSDDYEISEVKVDKKYNIILRCKILNDNFNIETPICTTEVIFENNTEITLDALIYNDEYYYDYALYEDLNSIKNKYQRILSNLITNSDNYKKIIIHDPSYNDEESESEEIIVDEESESESDDYF